MRESRIKNPRRSRFPTLRGKYELQGIQKTRSLILDSFRNSCFAVRNSRQGFTLLEMIISIGLFSALMIVAIGVMLAVSKAQVKATSIQATQDNIRFSLELLKKEMQTGTDFTTTTICAPLSLGIQFLSHNSSAGTESRVYYLDQASGKIMRAKESVTTSDQCYGETNNVFAPLTADEVNVENLFFALHGETSASAGPQFDGQPWVTVSMRVSSRNPRFGEQANMELQTTIVPRWRDL